MANAYLVWILDLPWQHVKQVSRLASGTHLKAEHSRCCEGRDRAMEFTVYSVEPLASSRLVGKPVSRKAFEGEPEAFLWYLWVSGHMPITSVQ